MEEDVIIIHILKLIVYAVLALMLFFLKMPENPELKNYVISRRIIAIAYLCLVFSNIMHLMMGKRDLTDFSLMNFSARFVFVASLQALLFTYSLITLIDARYVTQNRVLKQLAFISIFYVPALAGMITNNGEVLQIGVYFFSAYYAFLLFYYTYVFRKKEKQFHRASDNFFSDDETRRVQWVQTIFYIAVFLIGIWALAVVVFPKEEWLESLFSIVCIFVYFYFGVKYINYIPDFYVLQPVVLCPDEKEADDSTTETSCNDGNLTQRLQQWVENKSFTQNGINISDLATQLNTNRTYLSNYINSREGVNFNTWLNRLRIEESKAMLLSNPDISFSELSSNLGYPNQSVFSRQFSVVEGITPSAWRKNIRC